MVRNSLWPKDLSTPYFFHEGFDINFFQRRFPARDVLSAQRRAWRTNDLSASERQLRSNINKLSDFDNKNVVFQTSNTMLHFMNWMEIMFRFKMFSIMKRVLSLNKRTIKWRIFMCQKWRYIQVAVFCLRNFLFFGNLRGEVSLICRSKV